ncbi:efflux RND transporter periplasmic adaptor subunit [Armatimonas sp.]|uniref:efflux RND transporter periplasmic adaptor subunit n=1 Tax=Armatimonas sp. TaxID=1872638 RepID=UPI003750F17D
MNQKALVLHKVPALWISFFASLGLLAGCSKKATEEEAKAETPAAVVTVTKAERQDIEETVTAQGTFQSAQGAAAKLAPQMAGRLVSVLVKEGDQVTAGQILATLDTRALTAQTRSAEAGYRASTATASQAQLAARAAASDQESSVRVAQLAIDAARVEQEGAVQAAQTTLTLAKTDLTKTLAGARPQEILQAQSALRQAEATRTRAVKEVERQTFLLEKGVSARRQVEDAQTALTVAETTVESARQTLELLQAGARQEDREAAQLRVRQAEEALSQARKTGEAKLVQAKALLRQAEKQTLAVAAKVQEARAAQSGAGKAAADVETSRTQSDYATLRAPLSGVVVRRLLNPGDMADPAATILEIANSRQLDILATLPADDALRVRPGQKAHLSSGEMARVISIGSVDPQTNLVTLRLQAGSSKSVRAGAFILVKVVIRVASQAIVVPKECVLNHERKSVVFIVKGDVAKETPITTGVETDTAVEIRSGLAAGARVITLGQYELSDGAKIKVEAP